MKNIKRVRAPYYEGAPAIVREKVAAFYGPFKNTPCPFDVIFVEVEGTQAVGLDFDNEGARGCHFFLERWQMSDYRRRVAKRKARWLDLPKATQSAIVAYLESE